MFQEMGESGLPVDVKMISVCLCANKRTRIDRMHLVCTSVAPEAFGIHTPTSMLCADAV